MANEPPETPPADPSDPAGPSDPAEDAVDEELARLTPTPRRRSPLIALVVIALAAVVLFHLRADLLYAFAGRTPTELGDARNLPATLGDDTFATVRGQPDFRNALTIEPRGQRDRETFFRLLGSGSRMFVRAADTTFRADLSQAWTGRLRRFDAQPYAPSLRHYFAEKVKARRFLSPSVLRDALAKPPGAALRDRAGEPLSLAAGSPIAVDVAWPDRILVLMSKDRYATLGDAQHELARLGLKVEPGYPSADDFSLLVAAPAADRNAIIDKLDGAGYRFRAAGERFEARRADLQATGPGLLFSAATAIGVDGTRSPARALPMVVPWENLQAASISSPIVVPANAWVLTEGEAPRAFWWAPLLALLLVGFAAFNAWYLVVRGRRA